MCNALFQPGSALTRSVGCLLVLATISSCREARQSARTTTATVSGPPAASSAPDPTLLVALAHEDMLDDQLNRTLEQCVLPTSRRLLLLLPSQPLLLELELLENGQPLRQSWQAAARVLMKAADSDEDETTTWDELMSSELAGDNPNPRAAAANQAMVTAAYDTNGDKNVDAVELIRFINRAVRGQGFLVVRSNRPRPAAPTDVLGWLDRDANDRLDPVELRRVGNRLQARDADGDGKIWLADFRSNSTLPANAMRQPSRTEKRSEILDVDEIEDWNLALYDLQHAYSFGDTLSVADLPADAALAGVDEDQDGTIRIDELRGLVYCRPDAIVRIDLSDGPDVLHIEPVGMRIRSQARSSTRSRVVGDQLQLRVQLRDETEGELTDEQRALLEVRLVASLDKLDDDLFSQLDTDGSDYLSNEEVAAAIDVVAEYDRNADGTVSRDELASGKVLVVGRLPLEQRPPAPPRQTMEASADAGQPIWFVHMDANRNGIIERGEFLGNAAQFVALDTNANGQLDLAEARQVPANAAAQENYSESL